MKVLIVNTMVPFVRGGAEELAQNLRDNLQLAGHEAEILRLPFRWSPPAVLPSQMLMMRALELYNVDRVIALKFPAYLIRHPEKTLWLLHQYRQAYDLFDAGQTDIPRTEEGDELRRLIRNADRESFAESRRVFVNSEVTQARLATYTDFSGEILRPPVNQEELFMGGAASGYIFAGGRVNAMKRQHLVLKALALTPADVRLVIAGPPDTPEDARVLEALVEQLGLSDRVQLELRYLPREDLADYVNHASAVACVPYDEDSLSYVAMEAAAARKPVITTHDSGGVLGLARHRETGWVSDAAPEALAEGMAALAADAGLAVRLGEAAHELWVAMGITWPQTIARLLE